MGNDSRLLTHEQYVATMGDRARRHPPGDLSAGLAGYVAVIRAEDLRRHDVDWDSAIDGWMTVEGEWRHVMFGCSDPNVFLTIVVHAHDGKVFGHYLLDLNEQYGLNEA